MIVWILYVILILLKRKKYLQYNIIFTPIPTFPQGGRRFWKLFPLGGNWKGGLLLNLFFNIPLFGGDKNNNFLKTD